MKTPEGAKTSPEEGAEDKKDPKAQQENITEDHPRFKEIYGKYKSLERKNDDLEQKFSIREQEYTDQLKLMREHNQELAATLEKVEDKVFDTPAPDPAESPEEHAKWVEERAERVVKKAKKKEAAKKPEKSQEQAYMEQIAGLADGVRGEYSDYDDVISEFTPTLKKEKELAQKLWARPNPPLAIYNEAVKRRKSLEQKQENADKGYVEGGTPPLGDKPDSFTDDELTVMKSLRISKEQFAKQRAARYKMKGA